MPSRNENSTSRESGRSRKPARSSTSATSSSKDNKERKGREKDEESEAKRKRMELVQALQEEESVSRRGTKRRHGERTIERELYRDDKDRGRDRSSRKVRQKEEEEEKDKDGRKRIKRNPEEIKKDIEQEKRVKRILAYTSTRGTKEIQETSSAQTEMDLGNSIEERKQFEEDLLEELGFNSFASTKGKQVLDNKKGYGRGKAVVRSELKVRQYINRKQRSKMIPAKQLI